MNYRRQRDTVKQDFELVQINYYTPLIHFRQGKSGRLPRDHQLVSVALFCGAAR